jgi:anti-sigma-K factor RskA
MNCEELTELYELYALGLLDGAEKEAVEEHLGRSCARCMEEMGRAMENNASVLRAVEKVDPPPALRSRVLAGFGIETRPLWRRSLPWLVAVTAVLVMVLIYSSESRNRSGDLTGVARAMEFLDTPGTKQVSFGNNAASPHGSVLMQQEKGMLLVVVNLPAAPAGKMYETWIVPRDGAPKPTGELLAATNGRSVALIPGPLDLTTVKAVAVSLERAGIAPASPTEVLFAAPI